MIDLYSRSRSRKIPEGFEAVLIDGWNQVFERLKRVGVGVIAGFELMEISLLDDGDMAKVHGEFLHDATPTDVITFDYGEILIGVETAFRQAEEFGTRPDREVALYGIHGMLHLAGFDDKNTDDAVEMGRRQEELLEEVFGGVFRERRFF